MAVLCLECSYRHMSLSGIIIRDILRKGKNVESVTFCFSGVSIVLMYVAT